MLTSSADAVNDSKVIDGKNTANDVSNSTATTTALNFVVIIFFIMI
ncbi:MAG: hypothetical protein ACRD38_11440 [Nitrososphaerales archaeon]